MRRSYRSIRATVRIGVALFARETGARIAALAAALFFP